MTEITLHISDEQAHELRAEAERLNLSLEEMVLRRLFQSGSQNNADNVEDAEFDKVLDYITEKNAELMRRLA